MEYTTETPYKELAAEIKRLDGEIKKHEDALKLLKAQRDHIQIHVLPTKMDAEGMQTVNVRDIGRLSCTTQLRVSTPAGKKFELQDWLKTNGYTELVSETVNSSTLKAFVAECIREGRDYPEELLNITSFDRVTLTKI